MDSFHTNGDQAIAVYGLGGECRLTGQRDEAEADDEDEFEFEFEFDCGGTVDTGWISCNTLSGWTDESL
ncbi:MAG: hypothetical protein ACO1SX_01690 [Actinomycetota bacterium]